MTPLLPAAVALPRANAGDPGYELRAEGTRRPSSKLSLSLSPSFFYHFTPREAREHQTRQTENQPTNKNWTKLREEQIGKLQS